MTAIKFLKNKKYPSFNNSGGLGLTYVEEVMIEFAQYHVQKALQEASIVSQQINKYNSLKIIDKTKIINSYPLKNIK